LSDKNSDIVTDSERNEESVGFYRTLVITYILHYIIYNKILSIFAVRVTVVLQASI